MPENDGTQNLNDGASGNQGAPPAWTAQLPDDLKANEAFTSMKTIGDLGKSYLDVNGKIKEYDSKLKDHEALVKTHEGKVKELEGKMASDYIPKPKENATDAEKAAYYKALGRPDKPEDYKFETFTPPKGSESMYDPTMEGWFRKTALDLNLTNEQAAGLYKAYGEGFTDRVNKLQLAQTQKKETDIAALKKSWGPKFDENLALMDRAYAKFSGQKFKEKIDAIGFSNDPDLAEVFVTIGKAIADDTTVLGGRTNNTEPREPGILNYPSMEAQT